MLGPILRDSAGLLEVQVTGTIDEPRVTRGVNQAIQQVFPETERRGGSDGDSRAGNLSRLPETRGLLNRTLRRN
jgi:hypothetical protein